MSLDSNSNTEKSDRKRSWTISFVVHALLFIIFFIPFLNASLENESEGILIAFGDPFSGQSDYVEEQEISQPEKVSSSAPSAGEENTLYSTTDDKAVPVKAQNTQVPQPVKKDKVVSKTENDTESTKKANEAESRRKAEELRKAELDKAQKEAAENQKKRYSDLFGKGQGPNNNSGNQGDASGDPDGKALEGISRGSGKIGGGLAGRGILYTPTFSDNSQKTGRVALNICVNEQGQVIVADFTQKGSTTSDSYLIKIAQQAAMKYKFSKGEVDKQCGSLTIDFKVQ